MGDLVRIGTRGSKLALWQAEFVESLLKRSGLRTEINVIRTTGDRLLETPIAAIGSKGVFTAELEEGLENGTIDIAVHSAKDLPSELGPGLEITAFTERESAHDVLVSNLKNLSLNDEITVGTSSVRRKSFLKHYYPHVRTVDIRGNLQTRIHKMESGDCDALLLAYAGVHRSEYDSYIVQDLPIESFTPAVGQGSIAVEASSRLFPHLKEKIRAAVNHVPTEICIRTERAFLKTMEGGCSIPAFGYAELRGNRLFLQAGISALDGTRIIRESCAADPDDFENAGIRTAERVLSSGGKEILSIIRRQ